MDCGFYSYMANIVWAEGESVDILLCGGFRSCPGVNKSNLLVVAHMHNAQCTMHNAQCTMHNAQCIMHTRWLTWGWRPPWARSRGSQPPSWGRRWACPRPCTLCRGSCRPPLHSKRRPWHSSGAVSWCRCDARRFEATAWWPWWWRGGGAWSVGACKGALHI